MNCNAHAHAGDCTIYAGLEPAEIRKAVEDAIAIGKERVASIGRKSDIFQSADLSERGVRVPVIMTPDHPRAFPIFQLHDYTGWDLGRWGMWLESLPPEERFRKAGGLAKNVRST